MLLLQTMRSALHYSARCPNSEARHAIDEECTTHGADKFAKDSVSYRKIRFKTHGTFSAIYSSTVPPIETNLTSIVYIHIFIFLAWKCTGLLYYK